MTPGISAHLPVLQVVVPMLLAPLLLLLRVRGIAWAAASLGSGIAFVIAVQMSRTVLAGTELSYFVGSWLPPYGIELRVDALSSLMLLVVTGASTAVLLATRPSVNRDIEDLRQPLFYAAWLLVLAGLCGILVSADAFNIFVFMEVSSLATYVLVTGGRDRRSLPAAFRYLIAGTIGATFYLIGVGYLYMMTGTLNLADIASRIDGVASLGPVLTASGFITIGLALKAGVFPLHSWLPGAYTYAPNAVTAFIAACSTKVSLYVLLRVNFSVFHGHLDDHDQLFQGLLTVLGVLAVLTASIAALASSNLKKMLAFSSVAQTGYILIGASFVTSMGLTAGLVHLFNHALIKGTLFLAVACLGMHFRALSLSDLAGAGRTMPWTMAALVLAALSLVGMPGTAGFITKWYLISEAVQHGLHGALLVAAILLSSLLAVAYVWKIVEAAYFGQPASGTAPPIGEAPPMMLIITIAAALANIYFGVFPGLPLDLATGAATTLFGSPG